MRICGMPAELVILDVDGVILDILGGLRGNLEKAAVHLGLPLDPIAENLNEIALGKRRIKGNARDSTPMIWPHLTESEITEFVDYFHEIERMFPYALINGSLEAISYFRNQGIPMALATNNPLKNLLWRFEAVGIDPLWFAAIVTKDNPYFKPHPKTFDPIFEATGIARDHACYIGDLQIDWDMARGVGVSFIAVLTGGVPREAFLHEGVPDAHIFDRLGDVLRCVEI